MLPPIILHVKCEGGDLVNQRGSWSVPHSSSLPCFCHTRENVSAARWATVPTHILPHCAAVKHGSALTSLQCYLPAREWTTSDRSQLVSLLQWFMRLKTRALRKAFASSASASKLAGCSSAKLIQASIYHWSSKPSRSLPAASLSFIVSCQRTGPPG